MCRWKKTRPKTGMGALDIVLWLADYCCRCGKMFGHGDRLAIIRFGEMARPAHADGCVSGEDLIMMWGEWRYHELDASPPDPKRRR